MHIVWAFEGCVEVEIADLNGHEFSTICGDDADDDKFDKQHICSWCADIIRSSPNIIWVWFGLTLEGCTVQMNLA